MRRPATPARRPAVSVEQIAVLASLFWALAANRVFFGAALQDLSGPGRWGFALALGLLMCSLQCLLLLLLANRWTVKPLVGALTVVAAVASWFMQDLGVVLDPSMLRNVLRTDVAEARELWSLRLLAHLLLYAGLPLLLLWRLPIERRLWRSALLRRGVAIVVSALLGLGLLLALFQPLASLMRNRHELRYLITPSNVLWSTGAALAADARQAARPRLPLDEAARLAGDARSPRPRVLVLVVGETARAANWGLSGYARPTTPELARLPVLNFAQVQACGSDTETSLPCMFAPVGRRDYDARRIRGSESLLHLLARAGVAVHWRDNQSGCKGVCAGLPQDTVASLNPSGLCADGRCLDEGLLVGLDERLARAQGVQVWVLHMLGNHGPAYFRRYPPAFARFQPACASDDLRQCSQAEIVNAYDNALLYTDHVLASLIAKLAQHAAQVDSSLIYLSDHGESLGEKGLYLHGMPYAIAPAEQTRVPMLMWWSAGWPARSGLDTDCLRRRSAQPTSHDALFHTVLGLLEVQTKVYEPAWDLTAGCRSAASVDDRIGVSRSNPGPRPTAPAGSPAAPPRA